MVKTDFELNEKVILQEHQRFALEDSVRAGCGGIQVGSVASNFMRFGCVVTWTETFPPSVEITLGTLTGLSASSGWGASRRLSTGC